MTRRPKMVNPFRFVPPTRLARSWRFVIGGVVVVSMAACSQLTPVPWARPIAGDGVAAGSKEVPLAITPPAAALDGSAGATGVSTPTTVAQPPAAATVVPQAPAPAPGVLGSVAVKRGPIADELLLNGRIVGVDEQPLSFTQGGAVSAVPVDAGQVVRAGQVLVELDARQLIKDRNVARAKVETALIRVQQAQAKADSQAQLRQQQQDVKQRDAEAQRLSAVAEAQRAYNRAVADLELVQAGATTVERSAADAAVSAARANLERAKIEQTKLAQGADPEAVRSAEAQLANAQATLAGAQAELERFSRGSSSDDIRVAEHNLERAQIGLQAAQAAASDPNNTASRAARDAAIAAAQLGVREAQERLAALRATPQAADVAALHRKVDAATAGVQAAQVRLDLIKQGPDAQTIAAANAAVVSAEAALKTAQDKVVELNSRPTPAELQDAQAKVAVAAQALQNAQAAILLPKDDDPTATYDVIIAQKAAEQAQKELDDIEKDLAGTKLVAPFSGVVVTVKTQTGTAVEAGRTVVVLAHPGQPVVEANVFDTDAARLARGQGASVQLDGGDGARIGATVADLVRSATGVGTTAKLSVDWQNTFPAFGATARVRVALVEHDDALLVPRLAVRSAADHRYVEVLDNGVRRTTEIEVGIQTADAVEVLSGLNEGDLVAISPQ